MKTSIKRVLVVAGLGIGLMIALYAHPRVLFAHSVSAGGITLHAVNALDQDATESFLHRVSRILATSVLGAPRQHYSLYSTDNSWRTRLFFVTVASAGGVVYIPLTPRHAFLSGIDVGADRLLARGVKISAPRTLTYYAVHELSHLRMAELIGTIAFHRLPRWLREGLPDYVALGAPSASEKNAILTWSGTALQRMRSFGVYAPERVRVSCFLDDLGWSVDRLLSMPAGEQDNVDARGCDWPALRGGSSIL